MFEMKRLSNKSMVTLKISLVAFSVVALAISLSLLVPVLAATHNSTVTVTPHIVPNVSSVTFTAHVEWTGGPDPIHEFRVYQPLEFSELNCYPATGWYDPFYAKTTINGTEYRFCQWIAQTGNQLNATNPEKDFKFSLNTAKTQCCRDLFVETRDDHGFYAFHNPQVCVDTSAPETTKSFDGPQKKDGNVEWIDGKTYVVLTPSDPEPHPSGKDKTWYKNILYEDNEINNPCWHQEKCVPIKVCYPLECINEVQEYCTKEKGYEPYTEDWYNCVESRAFTECHPSCNNWDWDLYREPFIKEDESCHILYYFSVDNVGNVENVKVNCFFVDKTPPEIEKVVGTPQVKVSDDEYWVTQNTPITLKCKDVGSHPSNDVTIYWNYTVDGGSPVTGSYKGEEKTIYFPEDSVHVLEFWCIDAVEKESKHDIETFKVDTVAPHLVDKYIEGPSYAVTGTCPPTSVSDICHLDGESDIHIETVDGGGICAVDEVWCQWGYYLNGDTGNFYGWYKTFPIQFPEESKHDLIIECYDALGNKMTDEETFYVDKTPPVTTKTYGDPVYPTEGYPKWITSNTEITLSPSDSIGPHDSGIKETKYRVTLLGSNEPCGDTSICQQQTGSGNWSDYTTPFTIVDESCHLIEYYSVDNVDKTEDTKKQCVFVDNTVPTVGKNVGQPQKIIGQDIYITKDTPITLYCDDLGDHPVDHVSLWYRYRISDDCATWGNWTEWKDPTEFIVNAHQVEKTIYFTEDSCHELEYYCIDALGNKETTQSEIDIVDTKAPEITKTIDGPSSGDCLPKDVEDECYIDGTTKIHVEVTDPQPHPVDEVICSWDYEVADGKKIGSGQNDLTPPFDINFPEESTHILTIKCEDALHNAVEDVETFYVDKTPPLIDKKYGDPYYTNGTAEWISSTTPIKITVTDDGQHKSGIKETKYRYKVVDDDYCWGKLNCQEASADGTWNILTNPTYGEFQIPTESCHFIEIMSTDNVEKSSTHKQCVFVDNTPPTPYKEVGKPKGMWDGTDSFFYSWIKDKCWNGQSDQIECWKITMMTPIDLKCTDPDPHPVDHEKVCFNVELDAVDATEDYCRKYGGEYNKTGDGYCCLQSTIEGFHFDEETEHNLKYYCIDALGNKGSKVDEEKFKVEGESFEIPLYKKWNLISVPFVLLNDDPAEVFNDTEGVESVWTYDPDHVICGEDWCVWSPNPAPDNLKIKPGWGYWVLENKDEVCDEVVGLTNDDQCGCVSEWLIIGGTLFSPATTPPSRNLVKGWNLIGYYGTSWELYPLSDANFMCGDAFKFPDKYIYGDKVYCALNSLIDTQEGYPRWSSLWNYLNCGCHKTAWLGLNTCADPANPIQSNLDRMYAGRGYWLELDVEDTYAPATTCIWNSDFECRWTGGGIIP